MQGFNNKVTLAAAAVVMGLALGAGDARAYPIYDDIGSADCHSCHPDFSSVGSLHNQHVLNLDIQLSPLAPQFTTRCNVCHDNGGGDTPVYTFGSNEGNGGFGCAGCHGQDYGETASTAPYNGEPKASGYGLRLVHEAAGVTVCIDCHGDNMNPVLDETVNPPYYAMKISLLRNACDTSQEDLSYDSEMMPVVPALERGLDNDGNGFADYPDDLNCPLPTTTTSTTTTTTTTLPVTCDVSPQGVCTASEKAKLIILEKKPGKEKVKFQLVKILPPLVRADFGTPVTSDTSYALCVYDDANALVGSYEVARGGDFCGFDPCWENFKTTGYAYADKDAQFASGIKKIQLLGGDPGKGKVKLLGDNKTSQMPIGIAALLSGATSATAQFVSSDGDCFGMPLPNVKKNDGLAFTAQTP
ncbi:MAG: hypothetical protein ABR587_15200 [Candidatus Binatia bacterium]